MPRKPIGVYLDQAHWYTASRMVKQALDGAGDLLGFISFLEQEALHLKNMSDVSQGVISAWASEWTPIYERQSKFSKNGSWSDFLSKTADYAVFFDNLQTKVGMESKVLHLLGLYILDKSLPKGLASIAVDECKPHLPKIATNIQKILELIQSDPGGTSLKPIQVVWKKDRIEIYPPGVRLDRSQSLYLDSTAHRFFTESFGGNALNLIVGQIVRGLGNPKNRIKGAHSFDVELSRLGAVTGVFDEDCEEILSAYLLSMAREKDVSGQISRETAKTFVNYLINPERFERDLPESIQRELDKLNLTLEKVSPKGSWNRYSSRRALMIFFELDHDIPSRANLAKIFSRLASSVSSKDLYGGTWNANEKGQEVHPNPVAYHVLRLFQEYARQVLPDSIPGRTDAAVLCSLAQLPYLEDPAEMTSPREVLEIWTGKDVDMLPSGDWRIATGKETGLVFTGELVQTWLVVLAEALGDADSLNTLRELIGLEQRSTLRIGPAFLQYLFDQSVGEYALTEWPVFRTLVEWNGSLISD